MGDTKHSEFKVDNINLNLLCENPLVYKSTPLVTLNREIWNSSSKRFQARVLLDCGATTNYVARKFVIRNGLATTLHEGKDIQVTLGDNKTVTSKLEVTAIAVQVSPKEKPYTTVAIVFDIPDDFDCILGMPFFEDTQPDIDWKARTINARPKEQDSSSDNHAKELEPIEEGSPVDDSKLHSAAQDAKALQAINRDSCRVAVPETDVRDEVTSVEVIGEEGSDVISEKVKPQGRKSRRLEKKRFVEKMFTMGIKDEAGVTTKYIKQKKLKKFLKLKGDGEANHDLMLVLTNATIQRVAEELKHKDEPDNVGSQKAKRFMDTDFESFVDNPVFPLVNKYNFFGSQVVTFIAL